MDAEEFKKFQDAVNKFTKGMVLWGFALAWIHLCQFVRCLSVVLGSVESQSDNPNRLQTLTCWRYKSQEL